jgi:hypothetical protein
MLLRMIQLRSEDATHLATVKPLKMCVFGTEVSLMLFIGIPGLYHQTVADGIKFVVELMTR